MATLHSYADGDGYYIVSCWTRELPDPRGRSNGLKDGVFTTYQVTPAGEQRLAGRGLKRDADRIPPKLFFKMLERREIYVGGRAKRSPGKDRGGPAPVKPQGVSPRPKPPHGLPQAHKVAKLTDALTPWKFSELCVCATDQGLKREHYRKYMVRMFFENPHLAPVCDRARSAMSQKEFGDHHGLQGQAKKRWHHAYLDYLKEKQPGQVCLDYLRVSHEAPSR